MTIKTKTKRNIDPGDELVIQLRHETAALRKRLSIVEEVSAVQKRLAKLTNSANDTLAEEKRALAKEIEQLVRQDSQLEEETERGAQRIKNLLKERETEENDEEHSGNHNEDSADAFPSEDAVVGPADLRERLASVGRIRTLSRARSIGTAFARGNVMGQASAGVQEFGAASYAQYVS